MRNSVRLKRLKNLSCMLKNHDQIFNQDQVTGEPVKFNIGTWQTKNACGTAACALGSAALFPPFAKKGLKLECYREGYGGEKIFSIKYKNFSQYRAGSEFFGISEEESRYLFNPMAYEDYYMARLSRLSSDDVHNRVEEIIKKYEPEAKLDAA